MRSKLWYISVFVLLLLAGQTYARQTKPTQKKSEPVQKAKPVTKADASSHEEQVRDMVAFLEYLLNTVGSGATPARDKDVVVTESYTRIFRDHKVQVEDDLDESRSVITNKDVVAYLKDVNFFFKDVKFEFTIDNIREQSSSSSQIVYRVSLTRNLKGITSEGKPVNTTMPRFIEVNYIPASQDLKIVSMYTRVIDEKAALLSWWNELSFEWQTIFKGKLPGGEMQEALQLQDIRTIAAIEALDLSYNPYLQNFAPLTQLVNLRSLNLARTHISDLAPIRNLTELTELNLSGTSVKNLDALRYADKLEKLDISHTLIADLSIVQKFTELRHLNISGTPVVDLAPLANHEALTQLELSGCKVSNLEPITSISSLKELNISNTSISHLNNLSGLKGLTVLLIDSTSVSDITPLGGLDNLQVLSLNHTPVSSLDPLKGHTRLEKVYCDHTRITRTQAEAFMSAKPRLLVIFDSKDLKNWWDALPEVWQAILSQAAASTGSPGKEELAKISLLDSINIAGRNSIADLSPLQMLQKLRVLIASKTGVTDLSPLAGHREIHTLDISHTEVRDISMLKSFGKLKTFMADNSKIQDIDALSEVRSLEILYADNTAINEFQVQVFLEKNPECLVVYKSNILERWWSELSENWQEVFLQLVPLREQHRREDLHILVELKTVQFADSRVSSLTALHAFVRLKTLHFSNTAITDLSPLIVLPSITVLQVANNPIRSIDPIKHLVNLTTLDISNTAVSDLRALAHLVKLKHFNCSGTPVNRLNPLEKLDQLEYLDCSNTRVSRLDPVYAVPLRTLTCYNTGISKRSIENFRKVNPYCQVVYYR
jgi:Leucine-rich repeat (LRR) protein